MGFADRFTMIISLILGASFCPVSTFGAAGDCKSPIEVDFGIKGSIGTAVIIKFCEVPAARGILIGSENGDSDERIVKPRNFRSFHMAQFEMTQGQYKALCGGEPWTSAGGELKPSVEVNDSIPAVYVSQEDATACAKKLSALIDPAFEIRLPAEAEWEYAARAQTNRTNIIDPEVPYYWGSELDGDFTYNVRTRTGFATGKHGMEVESCPNKLRDQKDPGYCANGFGLYHMAGNVSEWTADSYSSSYADASTDGHVPVCREADIYHSFRVIRGGSWYSAENGLRSASRLGIKPWFSYADLGFRLVMIAK